MDTISLETSQNVTIEYELAGIWERILAFLIDTIILYAYIILVFFLFAWGDPDKFLGNDIGLLLYLIVMLPVWLGYHFICETMFSGQSIGKMALRIKVVKNDGQQMDMSDYSMRWMFRIIDILLSFGLIGVVAIMSSWRNQRIGDMVGDTSVIKLNPNNKIFIKDILAIKKKMSHVPTYEGVVNFTEDDMLLLKNTLERAKINPNDNYRKLLAELARKICDQLDIKDVPKKRTAFLKTVLNDYIVLTR
tara:strand:+ start:1017 stop:1760 length:744 start_codon:yes stop_codon:yes gene_type:complete